MASASSRALRKASLFRWRRARGEPREIGGEQAEARVPRRPAPDERAQAHAGERAMDALEQRERGGRRGQVLGDDPHGARQRVADGEAAIDERGQPRAHLEVAEAGQDQPDGRVFRRQAARDAHRSVERLVHQPRGFGLVGHAEAGIEIGLERELAEQ